MTFLEQINKYTVSDDMQAACSAQRDSTQPVQDVADTECHNQVHTCFRIRLFIECVVKFVDCVVNSVRVVNFVVCGRRNLVVHPEWQSNAGSHFPSFTLEPRVE